MIDNFTKRFAKKHAPTERLLLQRLLESRVLHVDETKLNILGTNQYVWVLTDGRHTVFRLTPTREAVFIKRLLRKYTGVLVSDFYGGYDTVSCQQQKCLVHLIRDLNDDLWKNPFNQDYEKFVSKVRDLFVPIFDDEEKYGLKRRHLHKHRRSVNRFYRQVIDGQVSGCEITVRYQKRFAKYRESLFRFLDADGIPWHNNLAERMLRHIAIQRKLAGDFSSAGAERYLRLLGIMQSCRLQEKSFLHFLLSGQTDVDEYKDRRR